MLRRLFIPAILAALAGGSSPAAESTAPIPCPGRAVPNASYQPKGTDGPRLILDANFPDPFVARYGGVWHAYATGNQTGGGQMNVQLVRARALTGWSAPLEAFPLSNLPSWVDRSHPQVWAPEVMVVGGRDVLYYNARHATLTRTETPPEGPRVLKRHCLGAAVADRPEGPFRGVDAPLVCSEFPHGVIDASPFRDGESLYVYYKDDGNCCGDRSALYVQGLSADGLAALGAPVKLLANDDGPGKEDDWEWRVVEAPTMVKRGRAYYLFYSGNFYGNKNYSVGYLSCASPRGPCSDPGENPILWSHKQSPLIGPGHQSILQEAGRTYAFFHGWNADPDGREQPGVHKRCLYVSPVTWERAGDAERPLIVGGEPDAKGPSARD